MIGIGTCKDKIVWNLDYRIIDRSIRESKSQSDENLRERFILSSTFIRSSNEY